MFCLYMTITSVSFNAHCLSHTSYYHTNQSLPHLFLNCSVFYLHPHWFKEPIWPACSAMKSRCTCCELHNPDLLLAPPSHIVGWGRAGKLKVLYSLVGLNLPFRVVRQELEEESVDGVSCLDLYRHGNEEGDKKHDAAGQRDYLLCC